FDLRGALGCLARNEARVASGLAQAEERLERREHARPFGELGDDLLLRRGAHRVVDGALALIELAIENGIGARRKLGNDVAFHAAKHEGPNLRPKLRRGTGIARGDGPLVTRLERAAPTEQAGVREVELAPELVEAVLDGRAAEGDAVRSAERIRGA